MTRRMTIADESAPATLTLGHDASGGAPPRAGGPRAGIAPEQQRTHGAGTAKKEDGMIDWARVSELREEVGPEDFDEVVSLFLSEVGEVIARLQTAPDPARLEEDLHFLKGAALNLGFHALAELCQQGESAAAAGRAGTVPLPPVLACHARSQA